MLEPRLTNPFSHDKPFRFGTIPNGATDFVMKNNFPEMHSYMKRFSRNMGMYRTLLGGGGHSYIEHQSSYTKNLQAQT